MKNSATQRDEAMNDDVLHSPWTPVEASFSGLTLPSLRGKIAIYLLLLLHCMHIPNTLSRSLQRCPSIHNGGIPAQAPLLCEIAQDSSRTHLHLFCAKRR